MKIDFNSPNQNYSRTLINQDLNRLKNKSEEIAYKSQENKVGLLPNKGNNNAETEKKLKALANEFTSILMKQMFQSMRKTIPENKLIDGGFSEEVFTDMLDGELSKSGAEQKGFNSLGRLLYQQLKNE